MRLPVADGKEYEIPDELLQAWCKIRPDALEQFARMRIWLESNSARRPKMPLRFINTWFKRSRPSKPPSIAAHNKNVVMGAIFGQRREVIDVEPVTRRLG